MATIEKLLRWLEIPIHLLLWLGLAAGFLMMVHVGIDVAARAGFNRPLQGTTEIVGGWYMVAIAFLPWAWIETRNNHIVAGMFEHVGGPRFNYWLNIVVKISTMIFISVFTWQTCLRAIQLTREGEVWEVGGGFIPIWPSRWMLPIAAGLMVLYMALRVASDLIGNRPR